MFFVPKNSTHKSQDSLQTSPSIPLSPHLPSIMSGNTLPLLEMRAYHALIPLLISDNRTHSHPAIIGWCDHIHPAIIGWCDKIHALWPNPAIPPGTNLNNKTMDNLHHAERHYANPPNPTGFSIRHIQSELKTIQESKAPKASDAYADDRILVWCYIKLPEDVDPNVT